MTSKESIQLIPKINRDVQIFGQSVKRGEIFNEFIHNPSENGWHFGTGDPEFWKFSERLIVPGGKVLDLGMGLGRTSVPFALHGMQVTGYENNPNTTRVARGLTRGMDLPITVKREDIRSADFGQNIFDTAILGETFIHFDSEEEALKVIDKTIDALKPGGHIWFRGSGKEDSKYLELASYSYMNYFMNPFQYPYEQEQDSLMAPCNCSGEWKMEPHIFFDPMELTTCMTGKGIKIVHTQILPEQGTANIMYGEDWNVTENPFEEDQSPIGYENTEDQIEKVDRIYGNITILGQKK